MRYLAEEIEFEIEQEDEANDIGLNSFRKGVFKVPLYLVKNYKKSKFFKKVKKWAPTEPRFLSF